MVKKLIARAKKYDAVKAFNGKNAARKRGKTARALAKIAHSSGARSLARQIARGHQVVEKYGHMATAALSGMGDYHVRKYKVGRGIDQRGSRGGERHRARVSLEKGSMIVSHSEYIGELVVPAQENAGGSGFNYQAYGINPVNLSTFPWLSSTAINFQEYRFHKLCFEFRSLVSEATTSANNSLLSMGSVIEATQYNSVEGPYNNKQTMAESDYAKTIKPSDDSLHCVECDPKYNPLGIQYVSANQSLTTAPQGGDIRMNNLGIFQLAFSGIPLAANTPLDLGEIWVHYEVELLKPQLNAGLTNVLSAHYQSSFETGVPNTVHPFGANVAPGVQPVVPQPPFGNPNTGNPIVQNNLLNLFFEADGQVTFPLSITQGRFLLIYNCNCETANPVALNVPGWINPTNCTLIDSFTLPENGAIGTFTASTMLSPNTGENTLSVCAIAMIDVNAPGDALATIQLSTTLIPTVGAVFDLYVTPFNTGLY